jgi:hypothetical protein
MLGVVLETHAVIWYLFADLRLSITKFKCLVSKQFGRQWQQVASNSELTKKWLTENIRSL